MEMKFQPLKKNADGNERMRLAMLAQQSHEQ